MAEHSFTLKTSLTAVLGVALCLSGFAHAQQASLARAQSPTPRPDQPVSVQVQWDEVRRDVVRTQQSGAVAVRRVSTPAQPGNVQPGAWVETEVPILTPSLEALALEREPEVLLYPRGDFYTLLIQSDDLIIEVFGTRLGHARPDDLTARYLRGSGEEGYRTSRTAYGRELNFNRYNVAYSITLECLQPERDPRCTDPAYGERLMRSLQILPGTRNGGG